MYEVFKTSSANSVLTCLGTKAKNGALMPLRSPFQKERRKDACLCVVFTACLHPMTISQLITLLLAGVAAAGGQFAVTAAYTYAPAKEISVYDYSQVIFAAIYGFIIFNQIPDTYSFLGYLIIIAMAIVMFLFNRRKINRTP